MKPNRNPGVLQAMTSRGTLGPMLRVSRHWREASVRRQDFDCVPLSRLVSRDLATHKLAKVGTSRSRETLIGRRASVSSAEEDVPHSSSSAIGEGVAERGCGDQEEQGGAPRKTRRAELLVRGNKDLRTLRCRGVGAHWCSHPNHDRNSQPGDRLTMG